LCCSKDGFDSVEERHEKVVESEEVALLPGGRRERAQSGGREAAKVDFAGSRPEGKRALLAP